MLNQETQDTPTEQKPPTASVAQARVTPEELSSALAAIDARRQAEAARLAGTIPIEEAVSGLHLDSTPDEIWAEVQAQRARAEAERNQFVQTPSVHPSFAAADAARREQLRLAQVARQGRQAPRLGTARRPNRKWMGIFTPLLVIWVFTQTGIIPNFWSHLPQAVHISEPVPTAQLTTLAQVPEGQEVYLDSATLVQISHGTPLAQISIETTEDDNRWTLLKLGGHVYLHGYIAQAASLRSLQGQAIDVYNDADSGDLHGVKTSNIKLRVDNVPLLKSGGDEDYSEITVPNFHPDSYTTVNEGR